MQHFNNLLRVRSLVESFFVRGSNKNYRIDDTVINAIRPPILKDILVFIKSALCWKSGKIEEFPD